MREISYGIIPLRQKKAVWEVFLVRHQAGHWAFPKGHPEAEETPRQAAERELKEETGLTVSSYLIDEPLTEQYVFTFQGKKIFKTVYYFLAKTTGTAVIQEQELSDGAWVSIDQASELLTFPEARRIWNQVQTFLSAHQG